MSCDIDALEKFVLKCVRRDFGVYPTDALVAELEQRGDAAYECLKELIRSTKLPVSQIPAGMRCLRVASKHQSGARWVDLLAFAMPFVEHANRGVRSMAAQLVAPARR